MKRGALFEEFRAKGNKGSVSLSRIKAEKDVEVKWS